MTGGSPIYPKSISLSLNALIMAGPVGNSIQSVFSRLSKGNFPLFKMNDVWYMVERYPIRIYYILLIFHNNYLYFITKNIYFN